MKDFCRGAILCLIAVVALAGPAGAQFPLFQQPGQPGALLDPQELEQPRRAPLTVTVSFARIVTMLLRLYPGGL